MFKLQPVETRLQLKQFIELPYRIYSDDPNWVPPLREEQKKQFFQRSNPMLDHCIYQLYLLMEYGKVIGRIAAFVDQMALQAWQEPIGLFGSYECSPDTAAGKTLLQAASEWLKSKNMKVMRGPWSFSSQEWGLVVDGFTPPPVILAPYNPPYYNEQLLDFGLHKVKDLIVYVVDARDGYQIPDRIINLTDKIQQRYHIHIRTVNMKNLESDVVTIVHLANQCISGNWGFYPVTEAEGRAMAHDLKQFVNPKSILIAETENNEPIGFAMCLPDINLLIKSFNGRLFPFNWIKLIFGLKKINQYRMWALGVIPEYQGKAIDTLLYREMYRYLHSPSVRVEINYVLEDNERMNNALMKLGVKPLRRYRIYEMNI